MFRPPTYGPVPLFAMINSFKHGTFNHISGSLSHPVQPEHMRTVVCFSLFSSPQAKSNGSKTKIKIFATTFISRVGPVAP